MTLNNGQNIGPYEIIKQAGKGGMGEVYQAKDTRLDRIVAIKVLPAALANNRELRDRFDREAKTISSLNHPNICTLYDVGHQDGIDFLVMEYIEGETLAERLNKEKLSLKEVLTIGVQIADALESAHRRGLVHRDLKPGNIMLTKLGAKLVDFGLARLVQDDKSVHGEDDATRTSPLTGEGAILGTIQYMAPEQLEGKEVDHRADMFSFGAVLYEMATGERAFNGDSQASLIASILKEEPRPIRELQEVSSQVLERTVAQSLAKDPDNRWQSAGDLKRELSWILKDLESPQTEDNNYSASASSLHRTKYYFGAAILVICALIVMNIMNFTNSSKITSSTERFVLPTENLIADFATPATISPDGKMIAYPADKQLWLRDLTQFDPEIISDTKKMEGIFWSPDSRYLAYGQNKKVWKYDVKTKERIAICTIPESGGIIGGCWNKDGEIVLAVWRGGLYRVSDRGGTPEIIIPSDSIFIHDFHTPHFLPDGETLLLEIHAKLDSECGFAVLPKGSTELKMIKKTPFGSGVTYSPSGHLLYTKVSAELSIWAVPYSFDKLEITGEPFLVVSDGQFPTVSSNGTMVYFTTRSKREYQMYTYSLRSKEMKKIGQPIEGLKTPTISPDGKSILYTAIENDNNDIWEYDLIRGTSRRLTSDPTEESCVSFFPTGDKFVFNRVLGVSTGTIEVFDLTTGTISDSIGEGLNPVLSHDGRYLIYETDVRGNYDLWYRDLEDKSPPKVLLKTENREHNAVFSKDDKWFAYISNQSGEDQIYLRRFPDALNPMQVSVKGGYQPFWNPSGDTLYWVTDSSLIAVGVEWNNNIPKLGIPQNIINNLGYTLNLGSWDSQNVRIPVSPDGKTLIIMQKVNNEKTNRLLLVKNWFKEFVESSQ
jgi:serine/threonine protein kinase